MNNLSIHLKNAFFSSSKDRIQTLHFVNLNLTNFCSKSTDIADIHSELRIILFLLDKHQNEIKYGEVDIPLVTLKENEYTQEWYPLNTTSKSKAKIRIEVLLSTEVSRESKRCAKGAVKREMDRSTPPYGF